MSEGVREAPTPSPRGDAHGGMLDRAGEIFLEVRELGLPARDEAIERLCAGTVELKKLVMLLVRGDQAPLPVEGLADEIRAAHDCGMTPGGGAIEARAGACDRIGNYRVLERIGEGGFGVVYMAEQERPVKRRVALKIIKLGMDTRQVVARFEAERQALALMDHPNIAKVFDAGATQTGRPFFVMELVRGAPITEYCDRTGLSIRERLDLIAQVCDALHHAHQKGVIHRDIKPSNVLVEGIDAPEQSNAWSADAADGADRFRVKIIDFGIAKATSARLTEKTIFTEFRQMIGTPEYMSPEQAGESIEDVDTRTDVYSTGVLLYELLTGATPFDPERLRSAAYGELQRIIREEEPPKPSTRLTTRPEKLDSVAGARATHPVKLTRVVRGELDWIVMKALEKDRSRRYDSAGAMGADIRRYLSGLAVQAAPPSRAYRARTFVRRRRGAVIAASVLALALGAGLVGTSVGFIQARKRAEELRKVAQFQAKMLSRVDATQAGKLLTADVMERFKGATAREGAVGGAAQVELFGAQWEKVNATDAAREFIDRTILRPSLEALDKEFADQPVLDARLRDEVAHRYSSLGMYEESLRLVEQVVATRRRELGEEHRDTVAAIVNMAGLLQLVGRLEESEACALDAMEKMRRVRGPHHRDTLMSIHSVGCILRERGKMEEAEKRLREAMEGMRRVLGDEDPNTLMAILNIVGVLGAQGKVDEAETYLREALDKMPGVLGAEHPTTLGAMHSLGSLLRERGELGAAEASYRETAERKRRAQGEAHPSTLFTMCSLSAVLAAQDKHAEAAALLAPLEAPARAAGASPSLASLLLNLGRARTGCGEFTEAEGKLLEAEAIFARACGATHPGRREFADALVDLYSAWNVAHPGQGYDLKEAEWRVKGSPVPERGGL